MIGLSGEEGFYGFYIEYGDNRKSIDINNIVNNVINKDEDLNNININNINTEKVLKLLNENNIENDGLPRKIDENISIRNGQYGDYIFYKKNSRKRPKFLKLNDFIKLHGVNSYKTCKISVIRDWIKETYEI